MNLWENYRPEEGDGACAPYGDEVGAPYGVGVGAILGDEIGAPYGEGTGNGASPGHCLLRISPHKFLFPTKLHTFPIT